MQHKQFVASTFPAVSLPSASFPVRLGTSFVTIFLAAAYLLPNHAPPWMSFLQEALAASALAWLAITALWRTQRRLDWRVPDVLALALAIVAAFQYATGTIALLQSAWMSALYLVGLFLTSQTGAALERREPGQALLIVVVACLVAGLCSVALQVYQLVAVPDASSIWVYGGSVGRPAANIGQPNSLATVQVVALLGVHWLWREQRLPGGLALVLAMSLLGGIALTQSRTGLLNAWIVALMLLYWNRGDRTLRRALPALGLAATALFVAYMLFGHLLAPAIGAGLADRGSSAGTRPLAWRLFTEAIGQRPLAGYGWGQTFSALLSVVPNHAALPELWLQTHNLLLDLAVWNGLPIAVVVVSAFALWLAQCARLARDDGSRSLLLVIAVVLTHAMLEYPLTYAYFLLPVGLAAGALGERVQATVLWRGTRWATLAVLAAALMAMALTVRDYLRVEHSYRQLLLEKARIQLLDDRAPPEVLVLTSLHDLIVISRLQPEPGMSSSELRWMADVVRAHPGAYSFAKLARALALNGREVEAQQWVESLCRVFPARQCNEQAAAWAEQVPRLAGVRWPEPDREGQQP